MLPLLLAACVLLCAGCARDGATPQTKMVREAQDSNGLSVGVPEGFEAKPTDKGFAVEPSGNQNLETRYPVVAYVSLIRQGEVKEESSFQTRTVGGKEILYRVTKSDGGSGGDIYTLDAFERVPGGRISYSQAMQSEVGEPDFTLCWTLVGSTKYRGE